MQRKRLKSSFGCDSCRARRKKCDETKPACKNCVRLGRRCSYLESIPDRGPIQRQDIPDLPVVTEEFISSFPDAGAATGPRTADHSAWWQTVGPEVGEMVRLFTSATHPRLASAVSDLESVIISGVWHGWASLLSRFDIPQRVVALDRNAQSAGHGVIARIVFMYYNTLLDEYINTKAQTPLSRFIPSWYTARPHDPTVNHDNSGTIDFFNTIPPEQIITLYLLWPGARARVQREPTRYCNDLFLRQMFKATRFIWPFAAADAIQANGHDGSFSFSPEFLLRISNIRSFPVAKGFLDAYPEFRGEIPQFEPSATWYRPEEQRRWEAVFWAKLRQERHVSKKKGNAARFSQSNQGSWNSAKRAIS